MKNLKKLLVINLMLLTIISCSKDDDPIPDNTSLDAPTIGTAMAGDAQATIRYTAPLSDGGSIITEYTATSSPDNIIGTLIQAESGTITVMGLTNGTEYTFTITAKNSNGTSESSSASNAVTPSSSYIPDWYYNCYPVYDYEGYYLYDDCYWEYY